MIGGIDRQSLDYGCWGVEHWHSSMALWNKWPCCGIHTIHMWEMEEVEAKGRAG